MGTLLDAQALIALLGGEPAAHEVELLLRGGDQAMSAINLGEAVDRLLRASDASEEELRGLIQPLDLQVRPVDERLAWRAGTLRSRYYHRTRLAVSLADCCLVAAANPSDRIATADRAVHRLAVAAGVETVALPDSSGRR